MGPLMWADELFLPLHFPGPGGEGSFCYLALLAVPVTLPPAPCFRHPSSSQEPDTCAHGSLSCFSGPALLPVHPGEQLLRSCPWSPPPEAHAHTTWGVALTSVCLGNTSRDMGAAPCSVLLAVLREQCTAGMKRRTPVCARGNFLFLIWWWWGWSPGPHTCKAGDHS